MSSKTKSDMGQRSAKNEQQTTEKYKKKKVINDKFDRNTENSNILSNVSFLSHLDFQQYFVMSVLTLFSRGFQQHSWFQTHQAQEKTPKTTG